VGLPRPLERCGDGADGGCGSSADGWPSRRSSSVGHRLVELPVQVTTVQARAVEVPGPQGTATACAPAAHAPPAGAAPNLWWRHQYTGIGDQRAAGQSAGRAHSVSPAHYQRAPLQVALRRCVLRFVRSLPSPSALRAPEALTTGVRRERVEGRCGRRGSCLVDCAREASSATSPSLPPPRERCRRVILL
jgi:hypothetical protein